MKTMTRVSIIALGLGVAGGASAHGPRQDYDALYAVGAQANPHTTGGTWMTWFPHERDTRDTLTGGPVGGLPDRN